LKKRLPDTIRIAAGIGALCLLLAAPPGRAADAERPRDQMDIALGYMSSTFVGVETEEARNIAKVWSDQVHKRNYGGGVTRNVVFNDVPTVVKALREKKIDILTTISDDFLRIRERVPLEPILMTVNSSGIYQRMVILVRRDSGYLQMKDLRQKRIAIPGDQAQSLHITWLETLLMKEGYRNAGEFFSSVKEVRTPSQAILPVFFRQVDACLASQQSFDLAMELNPQLGKELVVLARSGDMVGGVISLRADFDPSQKDRVIGILESLDKDPQGKQLLRLFRVDRLAPFRGEYLVSTEAMLAEHAELRTNPAKRR
jgi:ABC-type phosphate/phosphonate transport system substrate-binding protein